MTTPLGFDALQGILHRRIAHLPAHRKASPNTQYAIHDAALGAFGIFFTQSPSLLEYQRRLHQTKGHNNAATLFDVQQMPCDNQVRTRLDPIAPSHLEAVFLAVFEELEPPHMLAPFRVLGNQLCVALDGTNSFSSKALHCQHCLRRQLSTGQPLYYPPAITPVIVCPGHAQVMALPPEYIMPQDGHAKQDGERAAGKRWLAKHAERVAPHGVTFLGDDLSSNQPLCALVLQRGGNFIFTCTPDSHATLAERVAFWQATDGMAESTGRRWKGRFTEVTLVRSLNDVFLRSGDEALSVNWFALTVVNAKTGEQLYHNSCITTHRLTADTVGQVAQASRGRWKIESVPQAHRKEAWYELSTCV